MFCSSQITYTVYVYVSVHAFNLFHLPDLVAAATNVLGGGHCSRCGYYSAATTLGLSLCQLVKIV